MMLCCQYSAKKPAERGLQYQYNASFSSAFLYRPSERIYNEASWDQATSLEFKAFQFLCNNKDNLLSQPSGRFLDIPQHGMQHLKILLEQAVTK